MPSSFLSDFLAEAKRQDGRGRCLHYDNGERCNNVISAHSIQKHGQLDLIAEDGHVYRLHMSPNILRKNEGLPVVRKVGIGKVSTFFGFCKAHDNTLFRPIDTQVLANNPEQVALYAFRSFAREYFVKENQHAIASKLQNHADIRDTERSLIKSVTVGSGFAMERLRWHKSALDKSLLSHTYTDFEYTYFKSQSPCAIQCSGVWFPDFDFLGGTLQHINDWESRLDLMAAFTAPVIDGWAFGFAWHKSSSRSGRLLMQSLQQFIKQGGKLEDALLRLTLACFENHAIRVSWWDTLPPEMQRAAIAKMSIGIDLNTELPSDYLRVGCNEIADWSFDLVESSPQLLERN